MGLFCYWEQSTLISNTYMPWLYLTKQNNLPAYLHLFTDGKDAYKKGGATFTPNWKKPGGKLPRHKNSFHHRTGIPHGLKETVIGET